MSYLWRPFAWILMAPFLPFAVLLNEIDKFGKLIKWGRLDVEEAYQLGYQSGLSSGLSQVKYWERELNNRLPTIERELLEKYKTKIEVIEERESAWDYESGKPVGWAKTVRVPSVGYRFLLKPEQEYIIMPSRYEICAVLRTVTP